MGSGTLLLLSGWFFVNALNSSSSEPNVSRAMPSTVSLEDGKRLAGSPNGLLEVIVFLRSVDLTLEELRRRVTTKVAFPSVTHT